MRKTILAAALAAAAAPALSAAQAPSPRAADAAQAQAKFGSWGVDLSARDPAVKPGDSFFAYVNGGWMKGAEIPADQPMTGAAADIHNRTQAQLRAIVEENARGGGTGGAAAKVGGLYASFMDEARIEALDAAPLQPGLAAIRAAGSHQALAALMGRSHGRFGTTLFHFVPIPDLKGPKIYVAALAAGGMGLPDRDMYLAEQFKPVREAYLAHIGRTLALAGWREPEAAAAAVMAFERGIAEASWSRTEMRDPTRLYRPMTVGALKGFAPGFDWAAWLEGAGAPAGLDRIIVTTDTAVPNIVALFRSMPVETLQAWQAFHLVDQASPYLSKRFVDNNFAFARLLTGQQQLRPRWNRGVQLVDATIGEALGQEYVRRHFPASSKAQMEALVANLHKAMRSRIEQAEWMSAPTKKEALEKLARQRVKVGYPDKWRDYSALRIDPTDLYGNVERASAFAHRFGIDRLGKPVDRDEWAMTPQTVNAYFSPLGNEIVFPAAMLQAPMFDPAADPAVNYGAIGSVIGHEVTHGFDDQGRRFDGKGELRDWWAPQDSARFTAEAARLAAQYDGYEALPGLKVNGKLTLGENIGDQGGILLAYDAYKASLGGKAAPVIDGLTGDQRFFLAFAQSWRRKIRDDAARQMIVTDVHSPALWRVDGTLRNIDAWYAAFGVKPGDRLYLAPADRVRVW